MCTHLQCKYKINSVTCLLFVFQTAKPEVRQMAYTSMKADYATANDEADEQGHTASLVREELELVRDAMLGHFMEFQLARDNDKKKGAAEADDRKTLSKKAFGPYYSVMGHGNDEVNQAFLEVFRLAADGQIVYSEWQDAAGNNVMVVRLFLSPQLL